MLVMYTPVLTVSQPGCVAECIAVSAAGESAHKDSQQIRSSKRRTLRKGTFLYMSKPINVLQNK